MTGIERLREFAKGCRLIGQRAYSNAIADIADQIEREQRRDPVADVSMSAYDLLPEDEREAIALVREHGCLEDVRAQLDVWQDVFSWAVELGGVETCHEAARWVREHGGLGSVKKLLDWVVGHCSTKQQLDFDFWLSGRVMHELGFDEDMADRDEVERRLLARLMPEGMEWPRYDTGEPVMFGGEFVGLEEANESVDLVIFGEHSYRLQSQRGSGHGRAFYYGERVKRPAPKVLDADGVEIRVGDTVWHVHDLDKFTVTNPNNGENLSVSCMGEDGKEYCCYPNGLTHRAPVLAADGRPLRDGETVWGINGATYRVTGLHDGEVFARHIGGSFGAEVESAGGSGLYLLRAEQLTHQRPVLDADGVPIHEGDTVYDKGTGDRFEVDGFSYDGVVCTDIDACESDIEILPSQLTHTKPEPPKRCRDCAHWQKDPTSDNMGVCWFLYHEYEGQDCYAARRGDIGACEEFMPRAKALAGVSE